MNQLKHFVKKDEYCKNQEVYGEDEESKQRDKRLREFFDGGWRKE